MTSNQIKVLIGLVVVIWAVTLLVQGHPVPLDYIKAFSYAVTGVSFALVLWNRWLWSWRIFRPWLTTRPDLRGTWKGHLVSNWVDPITQTGSRRHRSLLGHSPDILDRGRRDCTQPNRSLSVCPPISSRTVKAFTPSQLCTEIRRERCFVSVARLGTAECSSLFVDACSPIGRRVLDGSRNQRRTHFAASLKYIQRRLRKRTGSEVRTQPSETL